MTAIERGTIYWQTCFAYRKMEARDITVEIGDGVRNLSHIRRQ
jgi:hypothetical protein